jgi:hypothetical protein
VKRPANLSVIVAAIFLLLIPAPWAQATKLKLVNLEKIAYGAARIFSGTCLRVEDITLSESEAPATRYTFRVEDRIKGNVAETVVLTQIGVREPRVDQGRAHVFRIPGMPVYREGERVMLFLIAESPAGLSSPVGLSQGAFRISERQGKMTVRNEWNNAGLWAGLSPEADSIRWKLTDDEAALLKSAKGPVDYDLFARVVRKILNP